MFIVGIVNVHKQHFPTSLFFQNSLCIMFKSHQDKFGWVTQSLFDPLTHMLFSVIYQTNFPQVFSEITNSRSLVKSCMQLCSNYVIFNFKILRLIRHPFEKGLSNFNQNHPKSNCTALLNLSTYYCNTQECLDVSKTISSE